MERFGVDLLRTSLAVGIVVCLLTASARLWDRHFSARARNRLWLVLALLLLAGPFLKLPDAYRIPLPAAPVQAAGEITETEAVDLPSAPAPLPAEETGWDVPASVPAAEQEPLASAAGTTVTAREAAAWIWALGAAAFALRQIAGEYLFRRRVRRWSRPEEDEAVLSLYRSVLPEIPHPPLLRCATVEAPMLVGVLRPRLLLPRGEYGAGDLTYIFRHELYHGKSRDIWRKLLYLAANAMHWFNPAAWLLRREAERDLERVCDERVVDAAGAGERKAYGAVLLAVAQAGRGPAASTYFSRDARVLKARLENILTPGKRSGAGWAALAGLAACGAVVLSGCFGGAEGATAAGASPAADSAGEEVYRILILGTDRVAPGRNYDAVLLATYDCGKPALDILSIPRNTCFAQTGGEVRTPGNGAFASDQPLETAAELVSRLTGTEVSGTVIVDTQALAELVDALGGVTCTVPLNMDYEDPAQGLSIHLAEGTQHLDGEQFVGLLSYQMGNGGGGYPRRELDRIATQQQALRSLAEKVCAGTLSVPQIAELTDLAARRVTTDFSKHQLLYLSMKLLSGELSGEDITFSLLPGAPGEIWSEAHQFGLNCWVPAAEAVGSAGTETVDLSSPLQAAQTLLARAFGVDAAEVRPVIQVRDGFWNITCTGEDSYVVEIAEGQPYPQTLYAFDRVPPGGYGEPEPLSREAAADRARTFLERVYGVEAGAAEEVFSYKRKLSVRFRLSETEVFHVQIHTGTQEPCGILYFSREDTARQAMESAGAAVYEP